MFYVTSENCYISVRIFVELLIKFVFMPSVLWSVQIYRLLQTKHDRKCTDKGKQLSCFIYIMWRGNALNFMNINIVFTFRHMDQNICRLVNLLVLKNKMISTVQWNILWSWVKHEQDNFLIGWPYLARVNSRASFGAMLKLALCHRFAALGMLVAEMFKTLIYLDVKIFNISNKNYLGIAWNLYVVK